MIKLVSDVPMQLNNNHDVQVSMEDQPVDLYDDEDSYSIECHYEKPSSDEDERASKPTRKRKLPREKKGMEAVNVYLHLFLITALN